MVAGLTGSELLGEAVRLRTYSQTLPDGRKETLDENVDRVVAMHVKRFPHLEEHIKSVFSYVKDSVTVPSMRSLQFGKEDSLHLRNYNCSFLNITEMKDFADILYLLACGTGVGYSVQERHISFLPTIIEGKEEHYMIPDTKESWADSVLILMKNPKAEFNYSLIRPAGSPLSSGGTASGPEPLIATHTAMRKILAGAVNRKLTPTEVSDIVCHIAIAIVSGGTRRSALICLFDADNAEMLAYKHGEWWVDNVQRGKANVSAVLHRQDMEFERKYREIMASCYASGSGEPGLYLTNNLDMGTNPCCEIALMSRQLCNLSSINVSKCVTEHDFLHAVNCATIIGTLQASMTDFSYIHPDFKKNCEAEALLGVSQTGVAENWQLLTEDLLQNGAKQAVETNRQWSALIGIKPAARVTCVKPEGSASVVLGTTSGIHAAHASYYLRRVQFNRADKIIQYLEAKAPKLVEPYCYDPYTMVLAVPVKKEGAIMRDTETAIELLERMKHVSMNWIKPGHVSGANTHNVSLTVNYHEHEKADIVEWMLANIECYNGISLLPFDGGTYKQMPFESITEAEYDEWCKKVPADIDFSEIDFKGTTDKRTEEVACGGGSCEIR